MIKMQIIGNIGKDAEAKDFNGKQFLCFSVAHTEKDKEGNAKTTWVSCAKAVPAGGTKLGAFLKKGVKVYVEGTPSVRTYQPQGGGAMQAVINLNVQDVQFIGGDAKQDAGTATAKQSNENGGKLPF